MTPYALRANARRLAVAGLRALRDRLVDPVPVGVDDVMVAAGAPAQAAPVPTSDAGEAGAAREGAAGLVDAAAAAASEPPAPPAAPAAVDAEAEERARRALLLGGLSGDVGPALAERATAAASSDTPSGDAPLRDRVIDVLKTVYDPEIPIDIYELGLIYDVEVAEDAAVHVRMTLTSPNCPAAQSLPGEVELKVGELPGVAGASVEVVFEPPWTPDLMSDEARLHLNL
jgi:FeS assembly SUF system protein